MTPPTTETLRRWFGASSLAFVALNVLFLVMVFSTGSPPPRLDDPTLVAYYHDHAALLATVTLISYLSLAPFVVFVATLRSLIRDAMDAAWLADTVAVLGAVFTAVAFVDFGFMGAAQAGAAGNSDPATVRTLEELGRYVGNLPSSLEWGMLMVAASVAFWSSGMLPRWVAWVGFIGAGVIMASAGSLYIGDTNSFWAADGGVALIGILPLFAWMVCAAIPALRARPGTNDRPDSSQSPIGDDLRVEVPLDTRNVQV